MTVDDQRPPGPLPLAGLRVVEFGHIAAAPFASLLLADLGADVVKIEPPDGDSMRSWPPIVGDAAAPFSLNFAALNRNKRSVSANLKDPHEQSQALALCRRADVVIENYRPGTLEKLGLGFAEVSAEHRGVVYCSISGFGLTSPYRNRGAFDVVVQAMSGVMSVTGDADGLPAKCGVPIGDFVAGLYAAFTIASLVPQVRASGDSVHLDCPMLDCLLGISGLQLSEYWGTGIAPKRMGSAHPRNAPYQVFRTGDLPIAIAAGTQRLWEQLCDVLDAPDLAADHRFADQHARVEHQVELTDLLEKLLARRTAAEWIRDLDERGIPCGPVNDFAQIVADPHVTGGGQLAEVGVPGFGSTPTMLFPVRIGSRAPHPATPPPVLDAWALDEALETWGSS